MNIIRERTQRERNFRVADYEARRLAEVAQARCGQCWDRWPASMMTEEDGRQRCPDCVDITTAEWKAAVEAHDAARVAEKQTMPQISAAPLRESVPHIRIMENVSGTRVNQSAPLVLVRSGAAKTLVIKGGGFASTDTFTYSTGISDSVAPSLSSTTQWTLTLAASGAATPGLNHVTFNGHIYRNLLSIG